MDSFEVPAIPKIFIPQSVISRPESRIPSNLNKTISKKSTTKSTDESKETSSECDSKHKDTSNVVNPTPKLCPSCSQILLTYLAPLQRYVDVVVQIARGDNQVTAAPLIDLFNAEVLKSQNDQTSGNRSDDNISEVYKDSYQEKGQSKAQTGGQAIVGQDQHKQQDQHEAHDYNQQSYNDGQNYDKTYNVCRGQTPEHRPQNDNQYVRHDEHKAQNDNENVRHDEHHEGYERHEGTEPSAIYSGVSSDQQYRGENQHISRQHNIQNETRRESHRNVVSPNDSFVNSRNVPQPPPSQSPQYENQEQRYEDREQSTSDYASVAHDEIREVDETGMSSQYAFVTIAYNNLSATNAIILANSLVLTNNRTMSYFDDKGNNITIQIPFVILIGGNIDPVLKEAIFMVFDEVISQPMDVKVALLSDQSFGIRQNKLQLWKELQDYSKCLFLESSTLVVAKVTNLFEECQELSACVDWLFPDNFNCSVFVFEPSLTTYEQIISFALFHQKCSAQKDEGIAEALDEMTLLNQFFAAKWNRISFVYNFVKNDAIYTQIPAFMKYGDSIKIVNFGHMMSQTGGQRTQPNSTSVQPWHLMFDLLASGQLDVIKPMPIDNFSKFYLNCFIQRLWPILQNPLTPLLVTKYGIGRREWSIFDLIRLLTNESGIETDDHMFTQTPITFRRIKSPTEKLAKYDSLTVKDDDDLSQHIKAFEINDTDEKHVTGGLSDESKVEEDVDQEQQVAQPKQAELTKEQLDERSKREWESGRIDWMGAHGSDIIINRLKKIIRND